MLAIRYMKLPQFILALATFCAAAQAQDKLDLRLRLKQGDVYHVKLTVEQHVVETVPPPAAVPRAKASPPRVPPQAIDQTLGIGYTMSVENVDSDGAMTIATGYESVLFRQKGPAGVTEYDSANPPKVVAASAKAFAALPGLGFHIAVTPDGDVKSVDGMSEMLAEMVRRLEIPDGAARAATQKVLAEQFGEAAMKQNMQNLFALYPPRPVAVGETWDHRTVVTRGLPLVIDGHYALKAREAGLAEISLDATITPNPDAAAVELGTGKMTYALSGSQHGSARVDEATGWTRSLSTEQDVSGTLTFDTPGDKDASIPVSVKSKVEMEPVEGK